MGRFVADVWGDSFRFGPSWIIFVLRADFVQDFLCTACVEFLDECLFVLWSVFAVLAFLLFACLSWKRQTFLFYGL